MSFSISFYYDHFEIHERDKHDKNTSSLLPITQGEQTKRGREVKKADNNAPLNLDSPTTPSKIYPNLDEKPKNT